MAAAAITPTSVQKRYLHQTATLGTPSKIVEYYVKLTKVTQNDWFVAATYTPGTVISAYGWNQDATTDTAEICTQTQSGTKINMTSATTGVTWVIVKCIES